MKRLLSIYLLILSFFSISFSAHADQQVASRLCDDICKAAETLYIYGFPLMIMDQTETVFINKPQENNPNLASTPINTLGHSKDFVPADSKDVVRSNRDTLYSSAWLDLSDEPVLFSMPATNERFYVVQFMDAWTDVFYAPGPRINNGNTNKHYKYALVGPNTKHREDIPSQFQVVESPTNTVWLLARVKATNTPEDLTQVQNIQDNMKLAALYDWDNNAPTPVVVDPNVDTETAPIDQVNALSATAFFTKLDALLAQTPIKTTDSDDVKQAAKLLTEALSNNTASETQLNRGLLNAKKTLLDASKTVGHQVNNWQYSPLNTGRFENDYITRTLVAVGGLGANLVEDAIYPTLDIDSDNNSLDGSKQYQITFAADALPPVQAFWSITAYDADFFFMPNEAGIYHLGMESGQASPFYFNEDGSLTLFIQASPPSDVRYAHNWLPVDAESTFNLTLRMYWPDAQAIPSELEDSWLAPVWSPPVLKRY